MIHIGSRSGLNCTPVPPLLLLKLLKLLLLFLCSHMRLSDMDIHLEYFFTISTLLLVKKPGQYFPHGHFCISSMRSSWHILSQFCPILSNVVQFSKQLANFCVATFLQFLRFSLVDKSRQVPKISYITQITYLYM